MIQDTLQQVGYGKYQYLVLAIVGVGMLADGMEMFVMSIVLQHLPEEWALDSATKGLLGGAVFVGMAVGAPLCGWVSDRFGRLRAMAVTLAIAVTFGVLSGLSQSFWTLMVLRTAFGVGVGGFVPVGLVLLLECSPADSGGYSLGLYTNLFALGGMTESLCANAILPSLGWAWLLIVSALPLGLPLFLSPCFGLVESPSWLLSQGRTEDARGALEVIATTNAGAGDCLGCQARAHTQSPAARAPHSARSAHGRAAPSVSPSACVAPLCRCHGRRARADPNRSDRASHEQKEQTTKQVRIPSAQDLVASEREAEERRQRAAASLCGGGSAGGGSGLFAFLVRAEEGPRLTACLIVLWAALSFAYYGIVFALPTWFERHIPPEWEYWATFFTAAAEVPGNWVGGGAR